MSRLRRTRKTKVVEAKVDVDKLAEAKAMCTRLEADCNRLAQENARLKKELTTLKAKIITKAKKAKKRNELAK